MSWETSPLWWFWKENSKTTEKPQPSELSYSITFSVKSFDHFYVASRFQTDLSHLFFSLSLTDVVFCVKMNEETREAWCYYVKYIAERLFKSGHIRLSLRALLERLRRIIKKKRHYDTELFHRSVGYQGGNWRRYEHQEQLYCVRGTECVISLPFLLCLQPQVYQKHIRVNVDIICCTKHRRYWLAGATLASYVYTSGHSRLPSVPPPSCLQPIPSFSFCLANSIDKEDWVWFARCLSFGDPDFVFHYRMRTQRVEKCLRWRTQSVLIMFTGFV